MTKNFLAFVAGFQLFRVVDHFGIAAAVLYLLVMVLVFGAWDALDILRRKVRGAVPPKGGRA